MDNESPPHGQFVWESTTTNHGSAPYAGAFFTGSQNFTVSGNTLTSVTHNHTSLDVPADFRRIPLGDIDLRNEIRLNEETGVIGRRHIRGSVRRMYSARIHGDSLDMTVALYQGHNAEMEWQDHITKYSRFRHPNFIQIFAAANSSGIHAIVAHDDLMPWPTFLKQYRESTILTAYIFGCWDRDRDEAGQYFQHMLGSYLNADSNTFWIRRSTGRLCVDLTPSDVAAPKFYGQEWVASFKFDNTPLLDDPNAEAMVIDSLELDEYHDLCYWHLGHERFPAISTHTELRLGVVLCCPVDSELDGFLEIAFLPHADWDSEGWDSSRAIRQIMEDGWTRYNSGEIFGTTIYSSLEVKHIDRMAWFSQANHVFHQLQVTSSYKKYVIINEIEFRLDVLTLPPDGYLFICPLEDLNTGADSYRWPNCPAYWSLDPSGTERLSMAEAGSLGFPAIDLSTKAYGYSWDLNVYAALRKFHEAKGFNADSQDVARHLGHPLYQMPGEMEVPFAHVDGEGLDVETERESYTVTNPDENGQGGTPEDEWFVFGPPRIPSLDVAESASQSWGWKAVMFVQLVLILALSFRSLYEYGRAVLSQRDI